ncbi:MAG: hypothetical protein OXI23_09055 [Gemmatimonadota bacterium]|nr:hypothetical protein [Gemmatimonadota bacterium]
MAEKEKGILAKLDDGTIIDRRTSYKNSLIEDTIKEIRAAKKTEQVQQANASISIIKREDQVAVVITLENGNYDSYVVVPADPYNLLKLAHKIQEKLDPSKLVAK